MLSPVEIPVTSLSENARQIARNILRRNNIHKEGEVDPDAETYWGSYSQHNNIDLPDKYLNQKLTSEVTIKLSHEHRLSFTAKPFKLEENHLVVGPLMNFDELAKKFIDASRGRSSLDYKEVMLVQSERVIITISLPEGELTNKFVTVGESVTDGYVSHDRLPLAIREQLRIAIAKRGGK